MSDPEPPRYMEPWGLAIREKGRGTEAVIVMAVTKVGKKYGIWDVGCEIWDVGYGM